MSKTFQFVPPCSSNKPQVARISGEFGLKTKLLVVILVLLVTTHSLPTVFGAPDDPSSTDYQSSVLENLREASESRRDELLYLFEEEIPSDILVKLQEAIVRMNEASELEAYDPSAAAQAYLDTLKMFRGAWEAYNDYKPDAGEESLVEVIEVSGPEPQPEGIEEEIKINKEKRIEKFQKKILKNIEEEESTDSDAVDSVFKTVKSGLQNINKMLQEGSLAAAVEVLKVTTNRYKDGVDEMLAHKASKQDKSNNGQGINSKDSEFEDESEKNPVNENSNNGKGKTPENKSNNGNGNDKNKTNSGNGNNSKDSDESEEEPQTELENEHNNNGKGNSPKVPETSNDEKEPKEKSNNGNGNDAKETKNDDESQSNPETEKSNNGNGNGQQEKTNNGNGNDSKDSDESEEEPQTEPKNDKTNNGKGNDSKTPEDETQTDDSSKKNDKKKSNNGKNK